MAKQSVLGPRNHLMVKAQSHAPVISGRKKNKSKLVFYAQSTGTVISGRKKNKSTSKKTTTKTTTTTRKQK